MGTQPAEGDPAELMDDRVLIQRAQNGDRSAVNALLERYEPLVHGARNYATSDYMRDEFAQIARIAIVDAIADYEPERSNSRTPAFFFWVRSVWAIRSHLRGTRRWREFNKLADDGAVPDAAEATDVSSYFENAAIAAIDAERMVAGLPSDYLDLLERYYVHDQSSGDIHRSGVGKNVYAIDTKRRFILNKIRTAMGVELAA